MSLSSQMNTMSIDEENNLEDGDDELFEHHRITVDKNQALLRIDKFLMARLPNVTRSKIQDGIGEGFIPADNLITHLLAPI